MAISLRRLVTSSLWQKAGTVPFNLAKKFEALAVPEAKGPLFFTGSSFFAILGLRDVQRLVSADLGMISFRIVQVMTAFDALCKAAGEEPPFALAFQVLRAPSAVQRELQQRLKRTRPPPPSS